SLSVEQIAERLDDRFQLLVSGRRTAPARQQTLRATIDWSYQLLTASERRVLRSLSVFAGGWTLEAAEQVCVDAELPRTELVELVTHLVDKSLVLTEPSSRGQVRFRLLESVRAYAEEQLRGDPAHALEVHRRFFAYYCWLAD